MTVGRAILGIALIMLAVIISLPVAGALRTVGVPINP